MEAMIYPPLWKFLWKVRHWDVKGRQLSTPSFPELRTQKHQNWKQVIKERDKKNRQLQTRIFGYAVPAMCCPCNFQHCHADQLMLLRTESANSCRSFLVSVLFPGAVSTIRSNILFKSPGTTPGTRSSSFGHRLSKLTVFVGSKRHSPVKELEW